MSSSERIQAFLVAGPTRRLASLGAAASVLLAAGSLLSDRPEWGIPGWAWLTFGCACVLVGEAQTSAGSSRDRSRPAGRKLPPKC